MSAMIPDRFDHEFLEWFRSTTEMSWATYPQPHGEGWQRDTRWTNPLSPNEIRNVEKRWGFEFPEDYRLFLSVLHTVDKHPRRRKWISEFESEVGPSISFHNWLTDDGIIRERMGWPLEGLEFDLKNNCLWLEEWGPKPEALADRREVLKSRILGAPRLIPIIGHRYLLGDPCLPGNPVLSVYQSDIIVYGNDLRAYLLNEFHFECGLKESEVPRMPVGPRRVDLSEIPFWGPISGCDDDDEED